MNRDHIKIHNNSIDIVQRFMAEKMVGQFPLKALSYETAKVREVLSTDLPDVTTKDDKADTLYLLEDGTFLHVEFQTTTKKHDSFRFAGYVFGLYNKYKDDKRFSTFTFKSVVIYAPHIKRSSVNSSFDIGAIHYHHDTVFLNEIKQEESYIQIIDKIRQNPEVKLTDEEKMVILYKPLFNTNKEDIENDAILVVRDILELSDESEKAKLTGTLFILVRKYLSEHGRKRIWEVLKQMDIIKEDIQKQFNQWHYERSKVEQKELLKELLMDAIKDGDSQQSIERLIKKGNFSESEVEKIYKEIQNR
ncbi:hypothetical protein [Lederbergia panacisoli]|uniref:hypothetical protein n=1 Tax=Lederbergia panacisoli TaxID=1255251 RepID=UPI00214A9916|nr:hypothetical protein [Lederbergia panacisoli]MCR2821447.1 hypothetical protein [Lederbergia panacisoli]